MTLPAALNPSTEILHTLDHRRTRPPSLLHKLKPHPYLHGFYAFYDGRVFRTTHRRRLRDITYLTQVPTHLIKTTACVFIDPDPVESPGVKGRNIPVARFVLECWVGPNRGRTTHRFPPPDAVWMHPNAPANLYWSEPLPEDDLTVYALDPHHNWLRSMPFPWLDRGQTGTLRDQYRKFANPGLT